MGDADGPVEVMISWDYVQLGFDEYFQVLLVSSKSVEPWSTRVFHPQTGAELWGLKGSELRGHSAAMAVPLGDDHLMIPVDSQSLITTIGLQSKVRKSPRRPLVYQLFSLSNACRNAPVSDQFCPESRRIWLSPPTAR